MALSQVLITGHTLISTVANLVGVFALGDLGRGQASSTSLTAFLVLAIATSATGFILPLKSISPVVVISILAMVPMAVVPVSRSHLLGARRARRICVGALAASEDLLMFLGVVQAFTRVMILKTLAPTQAEPPYAVAQASFSSRLSWSGPWPSGPSGLRTRPGRALAGSAAVRRRRHHWGHRS